MFLMNFELIFCYCFSTSNVSHTHHLLMQCSISFICTVQYCVATVSYFRYLIEAELSFSSFCSELPAKLLCWISIEIKKISLQGCTGKRTIITFEMSKQNESCVTFFRFTSPTPLPAIPFKKAKKCPTLSF